MDALPITVVIPCGDNVETLPRCIFSVINQEVKAAQIVVVYNSATPMPDGLKNHLKSLNVVILEFPSLIGPSKARNLGILSSKEEYVAFLDADDEWAPNKLSLQLNFMKKNSLSFTTTDFQIVDVLNSRNWIVCNKDYTKEDIQRRCHIGLGSTSMIKLSDITPNQYFDESLSRFEDWDFMLRLYRTNKKIGNLKNALTVVHRTPNKNWNRSSQALNILESKHSSQGYLNRHLASGLWLERAVIQFREKRIHFLWYLLKSLVLDPKQIVFYNNHILRRLSTRTTKP